MKRPRVGCVRVVAVHSCWIVLCVGSRCGDVIDVYQVAMKAVVLEGGHDGAKEGGNSIVGGNKGG